MKETLKLGIVLLLFAAVSAGVLASVNNFTEPIIVEFERQQSFGALYELFEEADDFQDLDEDQLAEVNSSYSEVKEVHLALQGEEVVGYSFKTESLGFDGPITAICGIDIEGNFTGMRVIDNSETPNLGTKIEEEPFTSSFEGKSSAQDLKPVDSPSAEDEVLLISGATVSVEGVLSGINKAREAYLEFFSN